MRFFYATHGGRAPRISNDNAVDGLAEGAARFDTSATPVPSAGPIAAAAPPAPRDISVDAEADFGYLMPPSGNPGDFLPDDVVADLDTLGNLMVPSAPDPHAPDVTPDSSVAPVFTYWGQFLDHELTARTDRDTEFSDVADASPRKTQAEIEAGLKNARTPRFDLDSVYGGLPVGATIPADAIKVISGMRHPTFREKMRVGTTEPGTDLPDGLDPHRDLPRFGQVEPEVKAAFLALMQAQLPADQFADLQAGIDKRALIGDMRNDENLIVAQFHLSFLRFHNRAVDFLEANDTGWIADFANAKTLTKLHYQDLITREYLPTMCDPAVLAGVLADRAEGFRAFRRDYEARNPGAAFGRALPLEFSGAAYRFGHTMVRNSYDYNRHFGRGAGVLPKADFPLLFAFTGGGGFFGEPRLPRNWIIDWSRFLGTDPMDASDGAPARFARALDTAIAPPMAELPEGADALMRHLARRNLRRGFSLRLPTGQAMHQHLADIGAVTTTPNADVSTWVTGNAPLADFLRNAASRLHERTPLWFYCLAEAEANGGERLGPVGSWIVSSTFVATLLDDPDSALSLGFTPEDSPLRMPDAAPIDSLERWMRFALVLE